MAFLRNDLPSRSQENSTSSGNDIWKTLSLISESSIYSLETAKSHRLKNIDLLNNSTESTARSVDRTIKNHEGVSKIVEFTSLSSQFSDSQKASSDKIIGQAIKNSERDLSESLPKITRFKIEALEGVILYPAKYDISSTDRCVVYHNPNGVTISQFMESGSIAPDYPPSQILKLRNCPVLLFDYRGTGISEPETSTSKRFHPTYDSIVEDSLVTLHYALLHFHEVEMWGSSMGGGVATSATAWHLTGPHDDSKRISVTNHDSFTRSGRVTLPWWISDFLAPIFENLNAEEPMKKLIEKNVKIIVLCHAKDFVIEEGARMAELKELYGKHNVNIILSSKPGHANLTSDMLEDLEKVQNGEYVSAIKYEKFAPLTSKEISTIRNYIK